MSLSTLHSPLSLLTSLFSLTSLPSFHSKSHHHFLLPTHHHLETSLTSVEDELIEALEDPVMAKGLLGHWEHRHSPIGVAGLWVMLWDCDLSLYSNRSIMGLWFVMWVCVLWWLWIVVAYSGGDVVWITHQIIGLIQWCGARELGWWGVEVEWVNAMSVVDDGAWVSGV